MAWGYMLKGTSGRFYLGATRDLESRLRRHQQGGVHTTKRLGLPLELVASREFPDIARAMAEERRPKSWRFRQAGGCRFCTGDVDFGRRMF